MLNKPRLKTSQCKGYKDCPITTLLFKTLENNEGLGIVIYKHNKLMYVNQRITEITGYNTIELLNNDFSSFIHPIDRISIEDIYHKRLTDENVPKKYKIHIIKKDGKVGLIEINVENPPVQINEENFVLAMVREIDRGIFAFKRPK